ncbi:MAG: uroporphyrinogen decarboxylase family protein [Bacteroidota bacterium]
MLKRKPDFENLLQVLRKKKPNRPTLFEFFLNRGLYEQLADDKAKNTTDELRDLRVVVSACKNAGYDYATIPTSFMKTMRFHTNVQAEKESLSLNEGFVITDEKSFNEYAWPDPEVGNYEAYEQLGKELPDGMKLVACGPGGVLENTVDLVGYENLSYMSLLDPDLTEQVFDAIGSRLLHYYQIVSSFSSIGAVISNDDWGFKTQTMFEPDMLRNYVFPWHKKIAEAIHTEGKPAILHSCGNLSAVMDNVIEDMKYDGKHSYEDIITPVETMWEKYHKRIAIMGGIDMDFIAKSTPEEVKNRSLNLLELTADEGSYALGSGNSIADYVPFENFRAMVEAVDEF